MIHSTNGTQLRIRRGFTLIEMLVVVAIIALLAAILFPAFEKAQENALRTTCQSNMKQMALATIQYVRDNDDSYPVEGGTGLDSQGANTTCGGVGVALNQVGYGWGEFNSWPANINPYLGGGAGDGSVFMCPADTRLLGSPLITCNYGHNSFLSEYKVTYNAGPLLAQILGATESQVNSPSQCIMWYEDRRLSGGETINCSNSDYYFDSSYSNVASWSGYVYTVNWRGYGAHLQQGENFAFCDGHVKFYGGFQMCQGQNPPNSNTALANPHSTAAGASWQYFQQGITWVPTY